MKTPLCLYIGLALSMAVGAIARADETIVPFPLGVYWPWERLCGHAERLKIDKWQLVDQRLDDMQAHHVDTIWVVNLNTSDLGRLAEKCAARQVRLIPGLSELHYNIPWRRRNWDYLQQQATAALSAAAPHSSICAWPLCDEPPSALVDEMEQFRQKFASWGAQQPGIVVTMWPDTPNYARRTGFPFVCTDLYPFFSDNNPNGPNPATVSRSWFRQQASVTVAESIENGKSPWVMPQMFADIWGPWKYDAQGEMTILPGGVLHWRAPTVGETRWQTWSALGLGAQGILYYVYEPPVSDNAQEPPYQGTTFPTHLVAMAEQPLHMSGGLIRPDGSATEQYNALGQTFATVRELRPLLQGARPCDIGSVRIAAPGWIGLLKTTNSRTLAIVVNDDTDQAQELTITGLKHGLIDRQTGATLRPSTEGTFQLRLEAGAGSLLEVITTSSVGRE